MKTNISKLLALALALLALPAVVQAQDYTYTFDNGEITITRYTGPGGDVTIPDTINGEPVTSIGGSAFSGVTSLTSVTIPNSVTSIGEYAFAECSSLAAITVDPNNPAYSSVGGVLFDGSQNTLIQCPGGKAGSYTIPDGVTSIGGGAFFYCTSLTSITIPNSVTHIGSGAFDSCTSLAAVTVETNNFVYSSVAGVLFDKSQTTLIQYPEGKAGSYTIPNSVTSIGNGAFADCTSLTNVTIGNSVTSIGNGAFAACTSLTNVTIGNSVTSIGDDVFYGCISLTSVTIPNSVTSIGSYMFANCTSLTNVTIGTSVTSIGAYAFYDCTSLAALTVDTNNPAYSSVNGVLFDKGQTTLILCPGGKAGSYMIPDGITNIGEDAFYWCTSLTRVTIPNSVTNIGSYAFYYCISLTSVTIGTSVTSIGTGAFAYCPLTSITIPNSVTGIGTGAFVVCTSLTNVTIGNSVSTIGDDAFAGCTSLTGVYFQGNAPTVGGNVFYNGSNATVYYLPGTTGWGATFGGRPTALWFLPNPLILNFGPGFGVQTNRFGFIISWATNHPVVVEASTDLGHPVWSPVATNTLTGGASYFSDPQWTNYPARFYRLRSP